MRNVLMSLAFLITFNLSATNIPQFAEGQQLYVVAHSGLNLRTEPVLDAPVIMKLNYGQQVIIKDNDDICLDQFELEHIKGQWVEIEYAGLRGYVFDGFLSPLAVPSYEFDREMAQDGVLTAFESWAIGHHVVEQNPDTISNEYTSTIVHHFTGNETLTQVRSSYGYSVEMKFHGIRVIDAYHLVKGLITNKSDKNALVESTIYIKDKDGELNTIKVFLGHYIRIHKNKDGSVILKMSALEHDGC